MLTRLRAVIPGWFVVLAAIAVPLAVMAGVAAGSWTVAVGGYGVALAGMTAVWLAALAIDRWWVRDHDEEQF